MQSTLEKRQGKRVNLHSVSLSAEVARTQLDFWPKAQVGRGARKPAISAAHPMAPAVPRAPWESLPLVQVRSMILLCLL